MVIRMTYSTLRIYCRKYRFLSMASKYVRILCGAQLYCVQRGSTNDNTASHKTEVFVGECQVHWSHSGELRGLPRKGVWTSVNMRVWTCKQLRVKHNHTSWYKRPPFLGAPLVPSWISFGLYQHRDFCCVSVFTFNQTYLARRVEFKDFLKSKFVWNYRWWKYSQIPRRRITYQHCGSLVVGLSEVVIVHLPQLQDTRTYVNNNNNTINTNNNTMM